MGTGLLLSGAGHQKSAWAFATPRHPPVCMPEFGTRTHFLWHTWELLPPHPISQPMERSPALGAGSEQPPLIPTLAQALPCGRKG